MKILIAEDDQETGAYLRKSILAEGHMVGHFSDGRDALTQALAADYDLMIVDRMMPGLDGLSIVKALRSAKIETPIIFLTALGSVNDKVDGLAAGADDYMVKPFALAELQARITALSRRPKLQQEITELAVGPLQLDLISRMASREGSQIGLLPKEFMMLKYFMERPGRIQTKPMLQDAVWGIHFDPKTSIVETHISRLRTKIDKPFDKQMLQTLHGIGYL